MHIILEGTTELTEKRDRILARRAEAKKLRLAKKRKMGCRT